jgi:hypothetical protein
MGTVQASHAVKVSCPSTCIKAVFTRCKLARASQMPGMRADVSRK